MAPECVEFLKWALPRIDKRWDGYKKVRRQVCRRIEKRISELHQSDFSTYRMYLEDHPEEWHKLDALTHIHISRFFRDRKVWEFLGATILPELTKKSHEEARPFRCWSVACASGEEPYSFAIMWKETIGPLLPGLKLELVATDIDEEILKRAKSACYTSGSLKEVPGDWKQKAFKAFEEVYCLDTSYTRMVDFQRQDIRFEMPEPSFDLIFCKNLVGMYFSREAATDIFRKISKRMKSGAYLILGNHEEFPSEDIPEVEVYSKGLKIYRKV